MNNLVTIEEMMVKILARGNSGNCDDTEFLRKHKYDLISCEDVETILSAFWVALEMVIGNDKDKEKALCKVIVKNIIEQLED